MGGYISHRVIGVEEASLGETVYITQGDANEARDAEGVHENMVIGKVAWNFPYAGYPFSFARKPFCVALFMAIAASVTAFDWANRNLGRDKSQKLRRARKVRRQKSTSHHFVFYKKTHRPVVGMEIRRRTENQILSEDIHLRYLIMRFI